MDNNYKAADRQRLLYSEIYDYLKSVKEYMWDETVKDLFGEVRDVNVSFLGYINDAGTCEKKKEYSIDKRRRLNMICQKLEKRIAEIEAEKAFYDRIAE